MNKQKEKIRLFPKNSFFKVVAYVVSLHLVFLCILAVKGKSNQKVHPKPLVVRNFLEKKPKPLMPKAKTVKTKKVVKKTISTPKEAPKKKVNKELTNQTLSLLKKLEEEISTIKTSGDLTQIKDRNYQLPKEINEIKSQAKIEIDAPDESQQRLVQELQHQLHLPEFGEVKCSFSIDGKGALSELQFVTSKSKKNLEYLKKTLPELTFPWFNLQSTKERQFLITFSNETDTL